MTLDRPRALNALSFDLLDELALALEQLDGDPACRAIVVTGAGERAFAAGADVRELATQTRISLATENRFAAWDRIASIRTPLIAAVRGFALGGGCELAMTCDMIVAGEDAQFGQPEIRLGVMPGAGGTQRLTRAIGKAKAMELILTGRTMAAREAEAHGLVTRVVPAEATVDAALELAARIAAMPPLAVRAAKAAILDAAERGLSGRPRPRAGRRSSDSSTPRTRPRGWPPSPRNARPSGRDADRARRRRTPWIETCEGGSDVGRDYERDLGDEPPAGVRDTAPDVLAPIDESSPVSGHSPAPESKTSTAEPPNRTGPAPAASSIRRSGPSGRRAWRSTRSIARRWPPTPPRATRSRSSTSGPAGLPVVYTIDAGAYHIVVNGDHLLSWGVEPSEVQDAAMRNLATWSATAAWTDEVSGERRLISSDTGNGWDAARILLPEVVAHLMTELGSLGRILVGLPERHLLTAGSLRPGDDDFAKLFADFIVEQSGGADEPIDRRLFELVDGRLVEFSAA